jgi:hypothetical protein
VNDAREGGPAMATGYMVNPCEDASPVSEGVSDPKLDGGEDNGELHSFGDHTTCFSWTSTFSSAVPLIKRVFRMDTGSCLVGVGNRVSCSMGPHLDMFDFLEPCPGVYVNGIKGKIPVSGQGTM